MVQRPVAGDAGFATVALAISLALQPLAGGNESFLFNCRERILPLTVQFSKDFVDIESLNNARFWLSEMRSAGLEIGASWKGGLELASVSWVAACHVGWFFQGGFVVLGRPSSFPPAADEQVHRCGYEAVPTGDYVVEVVLKHCSSDANAEQNA